MKNEHNIVRLFSFYIHEMIKSIADSGASTYRRTTIDGIFASEINLRYIKISLNNMLHDEVTILH